MTEENAKVSIEDIVKEHSSDYTIISARRRRSNALKDDVFFLVVVAQKDGGLQLYKELRSLEVTTRRIVTLSSDIARDDKSNLMVEHYVVRATVER